MRGGSLVRRLRAGDVSYVWYAAWIRARGLDLAGASLDELGLSADRSAPHANSGGPDLARVLRQLPISRASRIVDLGSGKGGACITMAAFPFQEILGIELAPELITVAQRNVERASVSRVHFQCADAAKVADLDRFTHVYLFNPFPAPVVQAVMDNLKESLRRRPRALTLVYKYPGDPREMIDRTFFPYHRVVEINFSHPFYLFFTPEAALLSEEVKTRAASL